MDIGVNWVFLLDTESNRVGMEQSEAHNREIVAKLKESMCHERYEGMERTVDSLDINFHH